MARANYDAALARVLAHEGGYTNHPSDPGGPTNFGITIADYRHYVNPNATAADVRGMRFDDAKAIYRAHYWDAMRCDELPAGLDYAVFDYGVNSGTSRAVKVLQRLVGLTDDGRMSDALLSKLGSRDAADLVARLCDERLAFLRRLKTWPVFGSGWGTRVVEVRTLALAMTAAERTEPHRSVGRNIAIGGIAAAGAAVVQQAGVRPAVIIFIGSAIIATAVGGWLIWQRRRRRHASEN